MVGLLVIEETAGAVAAEEERQRLAPAGDAANFFWPILRGIKIYLIETSHCQAETQQPITLGR